jgi:hypothetical protein
MTIIIENRGSIDPLSANSSANSATSTSAARLTSPNSLEDTIVVNDTAPPGYNDCSLDNKIKNLPAPSFVDTKITDAKKLDATKR